MLARTTSSTTSPVLAQRGRRSELGQAGIFVVLNLTLLFGVLGLTVDVGWAYYKRHAAKSAADAAALSAGIWAATNGMTCGAGGLVCGSVTNCAYPNITTPTTALQEACLYAQANGFVNHGTQAVSAQANTTAPPGVSGNSPAFWVQANVSESPFTLFGNFGRMSSFNVNSQAIAGVNALPAPNDVVILSASASKALSLTGAASLTVTGGGVYVDSSASDALYVQGSSSVTATTIKVHGSDSITGSSTATPSPLLSQSTVPDPLAGTSMPSYSGCDHTNFSATSGTTNLTHGVYCGGIAISRVATVNLGAGDYIIVGGGLTVGNSAVLNGTTGVTILITGSATYPSAPFACTGAARVTLTAPTSGTHRGLLFYQDRSANGTYAAANSIGNSCSATLTGTLYFPTTALSLSGAGVGTTTTSVVANTLSISGSGSFRTDTDGSKSALTTFSSALIN